LSDAEWRGSLQRVPFEGSEGWEKREEIIDFKHLVWFVPRSEGGGIETARESCKLTIDDDVNVEVGKEAHAFTTAAGAICRDWLEEYGNL